MRLIHLRTATLLACASALQPSPAASAPPDLHLIHITDAQTGRGIPLIELCTTSAVCFVTDSNGLIAVAEPAYWNRTVYFSMKTHGYQAPKDFIGEPGQSMRITRGGRTDIRLTRTVAAERLYRVTGEGIYRDSILAGWKMPAAQPLLNSSVMGLDTVMHSVWKGRMFWLFGDTNRISASLGNFATTCAQSALPAAPERFLDLEYFTGKDEFVKPMAAIPGPGMKWMFALMTVRDRSGAERLIARYDRMKSLEEAYDTGLAVFDEAAREFRPLVSFGAKPALAPYGRPTRVRLENVEYFYFSWPHPSPVVRIRAEWSALQDPTQYEAYTCTPANECTWQKGATPARAQFYDADTGKPVEAIAASIAWNAYRKRWVAILQKNVGEVWYAEADTPAGPWAYARRIAQHDNYTFYWPGQIQEFDAQDGRRIYFMGTYTNTFSGNQVKTPRYDYNQLMYALSLDDPRTWVPVAHYRIKGLPSPLTREAIEAQDLWDKIEAVDHYDYEAGRRPTAATKPLPNPDPRLMLDRRATPAP